MVGGAGLVGAGAARPVHVQQQNPPVQQQNPAGQNAAVQNHQPGGHLPAVPVPAQIAGAIQPMRGQRLNLPAWKELRTQLNPQQQRLGIPPVRDPKTWLSNLSEALGRVGSALKWTFWDEKARQGTANQPNTANHPTTADDLKENLHPTSNDDTSLGITILGSEGSLPKQNNLLNKFLSTSVGRWLHSASLGAVWPYKPGDGYGKKVFNSVIHLVTLPVRAAVVLGGVLATGAVVIAGAVTIGTARAIVLTLKHTFVKFDIHTFAFNTVTEFGSKLGNIAKYTGNYIAKHFLPRGWSQSFRQYKNEITTELSNGLTAIKNAGQFGAPNIQNVDAKRAELIANTTNVNNNDILDQMKTTLDAIDKLSDSDRKAFFYDRGPTSPFNIFSKSKYPGKYNANHVNNNAELSDQNYLKHIKGSVERLFGQKPVNPPNDEAGRKVYDIQVLLETLENKRIFLSSSANGWWVMPSTSRGGYVSTFFNSVIFSPIRTLLGAQRGPFGHLFWGTPNPIGAMAAQLVRDQQTLVAIAQQIQNAPTDQNGQVADQPALDNNITRIKTDRENSLIQQTRLSGAPNLQMALQMYRAFDRFQMSLSHKDSKLRWLMREAGIQNGVEGLQQIADSLQPGQELELPTSWAREFGATLHYLGPVNEHGTAYLGATLGASFSHRYNYKLKVRAEQDGTFTLTLARKYSFLRKLAVAGWVGLVGPWAFAETEVELELANTRGYKDVFNLNFDEDTFKNTATLPNGSIGILQKLATTNCHPRDLFKLATNGDSSQVSIKEFEAEVSGTVSFAAIGTYFNRNAGWGGGGQGKGYVYVNATGKYVFLNEAEHEIAYNSQARADVEVSGEHTRLHGLKYAFTIHAIHRLRPDWVNEGGQGNHGVGYLVDNRLKYGFQKAYFYRHVHRANDLLLPHGSNYSAERDAEGAVKSIGWTHKIERSAEAIFDLPQIKKMLGMQLSVEESRVAGGVEELAHAGKVALRNHLLDVVGYAKSDVRNDIAGKLNAINTAITQHNQQNTHVPLPIRRLQVTLRQLWDNHEMATRAERNTFRKSFEKFQRQLNAPEVAALKTAIQTQVTNLRDNDIPRIDMRENGQTRSPVAEIHFELPAEVIHRINNRQQNPHQETPADFLNTPPLITSITARDERSKGTSASTIIGFFASAAGIGIVTSTSASVTQTRNDRIAGQAQQAAPPQQLQFSEGLRNRLNAQNGFEAWLATQHPNNPTIADFQALLARGAHNAAMDLVLNHTSPVLAGRSAVIVDPRTRVLLNDRNAANPNPPVLIQRHGTGANAHYELIRGAQHIATQGGQAQAITVTWDGDDVVVIPNRGGGDSFFIAAFQANQIAANQANQNAANPPNLTPTGGDIDNLRRQAVEATLNALITQYEQHLQQQQQLQHQLQPPGPGAGGGGNPQLGQQGGQGQQGQPVLNPQPLGSITQRIVNATGYLPPILNNWGKEQDPDPNPKPFNPETPSTPKNIESEPINTDGASTQQEYLSARDLLLGTTGELQQAEGTQPPNPTQGGEETKTVTTTTEDTDDSGDGKTKEPENTGIQSLDQLLANEGRAGDLHQQFNGEVMNLAGSATTSSEKETTLRSEQTVKESPTVQENAYEPSSETELTAHDLMMMQSREIVQEA